MKRLLITLLAGLLGTFAFAQGPEQDAEMSQKFFEAKIREFVYRLELTDEQKAQFVPIYERYDEEVRAINEGKPGHMGKPATSEEAAAIVKARIENQKAKQDVRLKYVDEFAAVLDPGQLVRLYKVEGNIQQKLMNRNQGKGPGNGPGKGQGRGPGKHGQRP